MRVTLRARKEPAQASLPHTSHVSMGLCTPPSQAGGRRQAGLITGRCHVNTQTNQGGRAKLGGLVSTFYTKSTEPGAQRGGDEGTRECPAPVLKQLSTS